MRYTVYLEHILKTADKQQNHNCKSLKPTPEVDVALVLASRKSINIVISCIRVFHVKIRGSAEPAPFPGQNLADVEAVGPERAGWSDGADGIFDRIIINTLD